MMDKKQSDGSDDPFSDNRKVAVEKIFENT